MASDEKNILTMFYNELKDQMNQTHGKNSIKPKKLTEINLEP